MPILGTIASSRFVQSFATNYQSIATATVTGATASQLDFTSIPQTFTHLQVRGWVKLQATGDLNFLINGDTNTNYSFHFFYAQNAALVSSNQPNIGRGYLGYYQSASNNFASFILDIPDYTNTNKFKSAMSQETSVTTSDGIVMLVSNNWRSTSAITSLRIYSKDWELVQNSTVGLYGIGRKT